jgi:hypothetical protein
LVEVEFLFYVGEGVVALLGEGDEEACEFGGGVLLELVYG